MGEDVLKLLVSNGLVDVYIYLVFLVGKGDFEIVFQERDSFSDSDFESEDDNGKVEILVYVKKMLKRKDREGILDDVYNRYIFNDVDVL